ncbi:MAG: 50S ribosomal protein L21 [Flavobacteriaceae bacterium]|nr:50S ribosomal protein L21 [Flavobacteriaceae bacterium]|tara:strand:+ start:4561 stop:5088 length:528 start_codon:yes stop_codon:yes gene_type:complete
MYAIVEISGQQFKVAKDQKIFVHRLEEKEGSMVTFDKVLFLQDGNITKVGTPILDDASVSAKIINHLKGDKVIVFKKKRRKGYKVKNGHRQQLSEIQISGISTSSSNKANKTEDKAKSKRKVDSTVKSTKPSNEKGKKIKVSSSLSLAELKTLAKKKGIANISKMKKADLIKALN